MRHEAFADRSASNRTTPAFLPRPEPPGGQEHPPDLHATYSSPDGTCRLACAHCHASRGQRSLPGGPSGFPFLHHPPPSPASRRPPFPHPTFLCSLPHSSPHSPSHTPPL